MTERVSRRDFLKVSGAAILGAGLAGFGLRRFLEQNDVSALPPSPSDAPNVLLVVLDTVRARSLSLHGYERPTSPQLERLSRKGILFENAFSVDSWTLPSHSSMFTGLYPRQLSSDWQSPLDNTRPTLSEVFAGLGYMTAGFVGNNFYCSYEYGLDRGFLHYEDYRVTAGRAMRDSAITDKFMHETKLFEAVANHQNLGRKSAEQLSDDFIRWVTREKPDRPFFAFLNYFDAHDPYLPPPEFSRLFSSRKLNGHLVKEDAQQLQPDRVRELNDAYDGAIAYLDHQLGLLFDELESLGLAQNTLVMITGDHGEHFGDHELMGHGNSIYPSLTRVPLLILQPGKLPAGSVVKSPVSLIDIAATSLDLAGFPNTGVLPGSSLRRSWEDVSVNEPVFSEVLLSFDVFQVPTERGWARSLVYGPMCYVRSPSGKEELYDLENDPDERENLAQSADYSRFMDEMRALNATHVNGLKNPAG